MSEHSTPKSGAHHLSNIKSDFLNHSSSPSNHHDALSPTPLCTITGTRHQLALNACSKSFVGCPSPKAIGEIKSPLHKWTPSDRLRLIQFLQDHELDHALDVLPDDYTFADLAQCSLSVLSEIFSGCLKKDEILLLHTDLHSNNEQSALAYSVCSEISTASVTQSSAPISLLPESRPTSGSLFSNEIQPVRKQSKSLNLLEVNNLSSASNRSCKSGNDDSRFMYRNTIISASPFCPSTSIVHTTTDLHYHSSIQREVSVGVDDVHQLQESHHPSSLSDSSTEPERNVILSNEIGPTAFSNITTSSSFFNTNNQNLQDSLYNRSMRFDFSTRKSYSPSNKSFMNRSGSYLTTNSISPIQGRIKAPPNDLLTSSVASNLPCNISMLTRTGHSNFQSSPSPLSNYMLHYEGHNIPGSLLRMKRNFIGQSAPNLSYYMRDSTYNDFSACPPASCYSRVSSAYTPPFSNLKSALPRSNPNGRVPLSFCDLADPSACIERGKTSVSHDLASHHDKLSTNQGLTVSTSMASVTLPNEMVTVHGRLSHPFQLHRRSLLISDLGSLSGSSGCMADRSMSSPTPSNGPDSPLFTTVNSLTPNDPSYTISLKDSFTNRRSRLPKTSDCSSGDCLHLETLPVNHSTNQATKIISDRSLTVHTDTIDKMEHPNEGFTTHVDQNCSQFGVTIADTLSTSSFVDRRYHPPRLRLDSRHLPDYRRWSLVSLPSSGYGTNASENGSHLSHSRCSSREHLNSQFHPLIISRSNNQQSSYTISSANSKPSMSLQTTPRASLPIERSYSFRSQLKPRSTCALTSISPISSTNHMENSSMSGCEFSRSPRDLQICINSTRHSTSVSNYFHADCISATQVDSISVPQTPVSRVVPRSPLTPSGCTSSSLTFSLGNSRTRSRSLSPFRISGSGEQEILLLNHVYRERFPKASAHMQEQLACLADDMEHTDTVSWSAVARFVHCQVVQHARDCLQKALSGLVTCRYFYEMTENLDKLIEDTRTRDPDSVPLVLTFIRRLLLIIARPARLLECLEFDPSEFYQMLEVAEDQVRRQVKNSGKYGSEIMSADVPLYIISKLGLSKDVLDESQNNQNSGLRRSQLNCPTNLEGLGSNVSLRTRTISGHDSEKGFDIGYDPAPRTTRSNSGSVPMRPPCEADFEVIKLISNGAYGAVYLVRHKITKQRFSLKKIRKQHLQLRNQVEQVFAERDIMSFADNPFVVSLCCTFETKKCLCMVMEYVEGGDVATLLKHIGGPLPLDLAKMYFAETVLALEYLHNYGIVHRDLKPDNLLITHEGHIKLTDFGLSRIGLMNLATNLYEKNLDLDKDCKMFRDKQVFGTPEYIAPEVILRQGYGKPVDWWSMGIMLYEFLVGCVPFCGDTIESIFAHIVTAPIEWPEEEEWKVSQPAVDIITRLLEREPLNRLGTVGGAAELKESPFFNSPSKIDWNNLLRQKAAFVPQLEHDEDTSYFDPRTDRYHHDVENDEDICYPVETLTQSSRSSPAPNSFITRNFSFNLAVDRQLSNSVIRRPAASRLGRAKLQQTNEYRRCHSLGDTKKPLLKSYDSLPQSRKSSLSTHNQSSSPLDSSNYHKSEHDLGTSTLTAESVATRNTLNLLHNLSSHPSESEKSLSKSMLNLDTSISSSHQQQLHRVSLPETNCCKNLNATEKLNIDIHNEDESNDRSDVNIEDNENDDIDDDVNESNDSRIFHSFTSFSPRFSIVLEQARMNEILNNSIDIGQASRQSEQINKTEESNDKSLSKIETVDSDKIVQNSNTNENNQIIEYEINKSDENISEKESSKNLELSRSHTSMHTISSDKISNIVEVKLNSDLSSPLIIGTNLTEQPSISSMNSEELHQTINSDADEEIQLLASDSNSSLELIQSEMSKCSCDDTVYQPDKENKLNKVDNTQYSPDIDTNSSQTTQFGENQVSSPQCLEPFHSKSNSSSSTSSSLSLATIMLHLTPQPSLPLPTESGDFSSPKNILSDSTRKEPQEHQNIPSLSDNSVYPKPVKDDNLQPVTHLSLPVELHSTGSFHKNGSEVIQPSINQPHSLHRVLSRSTKLKNDSPPNNLPKPLPGTSFGHVPYNTRIPSNYTLHQHEIIINRDSQGFGFSVYAIRVYLGSSNVYTLHHQVTSIVPHGPAARAGLNEADLILSVNGIPTVGMYHVNVVKLILQSGPVLRLQAIPISQTSIRSDGPYRALGRLITCVQPLPSVKPNNPPNTSLQFGDIHNPNKSGLVHSQLPVTQPYPTGYPKGTTNFKSGVSNCDSIHFQSEDDSVRRSNRRLTIREGRHRHISSRDNGSQISNLQADTIITTPCLHSPNTIAAKPFLDHSKQVHSQPIVCTKAPIQSYASVAAQRFGIAFNQTPTNSIPNVQNNNLLVSAPRRSTEKPLLRQLSERQHRAMLATTDDATISTTSSVIYSPYHGTPYSSPHQSPRADHSQQHNPLNVYRPTGSSSSVTSSGWYSGGELSSQSSPGSGSPSSLTAFRSSENPRLAVSSSRHLQRFSSPCVSNSHSNSQFNSTSTDNIAPRISTLRQVIPGPPSSSQHSNTQCRHSDPVRPNGTPQIVRPPCQVNNFQYGSISNPIQSPINHLNASPNVINPNPNHHYSNEASVLVSSGQVRLRRRSHRFAVHRVASPNNPAESEDEQLNQTH